MENSETYLQIYKDISINAMLQLEDTLEILSEQLETLKLELDDNNQELEEIKN